MAEDIDFIETTDKEESLLENLKQETEYKSPSENTSSGWKIDDDLKDETDSDDDDGPDGSASESTAKKPKVSDEVVKASAATATLCFETGLEMATIPIIEHRFKKKVSPDDLMQFMELEDTADELLNEAQRKKKSKVSAFLKARDKKRDAMSLSAKERSTVETSFANYFKITGKVFGPELLLIMTLGSIFSDRAIEAFTD